MTGSVAGAENDDSSNSAKVIMSQELQETVSRLSSHKGVEAVMILNTQGDIMAEAGSMANPVNAKFTRKLVDVATAYIQNLNSDDELSFLQIQTSQNRTIMLSPHHGYCLAVLKK